jgi:tripartite ATP-independent transporter DctM subunit
VASLAMMAVFLALLLLRVPVCAAMGFGAMTGLGLLGLPLSTMARYMIEDVRAVPLLAIPFFVLAASVMNEMGVTRRIFDFANNLVGGMRGGLAQVAIVSNVVFAGISGSALADIAGLGSIIINAMTRHGYRIEFAAAIVVAASVVAPIIPPSIMFIIYAVMMNVSIGKLFVAGIVPGLMIGAVLMITVWLFAVLRLHRFPDPTPGTLRGLIRSAASGAPAILSPAIILAGMVGGIATPTEAGVLAVLYSLFLGVLYRELSWARLYRALESSTKTTAMIMYLTGIGSVMAFVITSEQAAEQIARYLLQLTDQTWILLLLINLILLILGCVLETVPAMLISIPILGPVAVKLGMDPLQFGVVLSLNLLIGIMTPPIGLGLFAICAMTGLKLEKVVYACLAFIPTLVIALLILTYVPSLSTWLPGLLFRD